jgi:hypothetical protein
LASLPHESESRAHDRRRAICDPAGARVRLREIVCAHGVREDVVDAVVAARAVDGNEPWGSLDTCAALAGVLATVARDAPDDVAAVRSAVDVVAAEIGLPAHTVAEIVGDQALAEMARTLVPPLAALRGLLEILRAVSGVGGAAVWAAAESDLALLCSVGDRGDATADRRPGADGAAAAQRRRSCGTATPWAS